MCNKIFKLLVSLKASRNISLQILPILGENLKILNYGLTGNKKNPVPLWDTTQGTFLTQSKQRKFV
jgi:hypothetical protein